MLNLSFDEETVECSHSLVQIFQGMHARVSSSIQAHAGTLQNTNGVCAGLCTGAMSLGYRKSLENPQPSGHSARGTINPLLQPLGPSEENLISNGTSWGA